MRPKISSAAFLQIVSLKLEFCRVNSLHSGNLRGMFYSLTHISIWCNHINNPPLCSTANNVRINYDFFVVVKIFFSGWAKPCPTQITQHNIIVSVHCILIFKQRLSKVNHTIQIIVIRMQLAMHAEINNCNKITVKVWILIIRKNSFVLF